MIKSAILRWLAVKSNVRHGPNFHVGPGSRVWAPKGLTIGQDVYIGKHCTVEVDGSIGDGSMIANAVGVVGRRDHDQTVVGVTIRDSPWVGENSAELSDEVHIGSDVWIGYGAVVLSGVSIGDSAIVGAGALVAKDVPPNAIVIGNPARVVGSRFSDSDLAEHWRQLEARGVKLQSMHRKGSV